MKWVKALASEIVGNTIKPQAILLQSAQDFSFHCPYARMKLLRL